MLRRAFVARILRAMSSTVAYQADDRSILLPYYKRFFVEPTLPLIPASVHPNTITHAGHLVCLAGLLLLAATNPSQGWVYLASMVMLQAYNWCDNADGAHARRTRQSSVLGEFLDHGLDVLNTLYIGLMTILALGSSPEYAIALAILIPAAPPMTIWEQTETGVYRLGLLNQIESIFVLSFVMVVDAIFGRGVWHQLRLGPLSAWQFFHLWPIVTILFGYGRAMWRVFRAGRPVGPALAFLCAQGAVAVAGVTHAISLPAAIAFAVGVNVYFGARMLALRFRAERPQVEPLLVAVALSLGAYGVAARQGLSLPGDVGAALTVLACAVIGLQSVRETRDSMQSLARIRS
jgi:hypothetical protein